MTKITTGLAVASLAALTIGAAAPAVAAPNASSSASSDASSTADVGATTAGPESPVVRRVESWGPRQFAVNGVALGAEMVQVTLPGGGGDLPRVVNGRFTALLDIEHLGKTATLTAIGTDGRSAPVEVTLDLGLAENEDKAPAAPVVHAVSSYDDEFLVIEGTAVSDPYIFSHATVVAPRVGLVYDSPDANGSFSLKVPVAHRGETIQVQTYQSGLESAVVEVVLEETETNTASEAFPLEVASPATGEVVTAPEATFTGSAIPNSQIVVTRDGETSRTSSTLCETRVASSGDWSCTSPTLPEGGYATTVTETPTWQSAATQTAGTAFSVAGQEDSYDQAQLPSVSSVSIDRRGDLVVRVISHGASDVRLEVGDVVEKKGAIHGRATFTLDAELLGGAATLTGVRGDVDGRSLDLPLDLIEAAPDSPLTAPLVHGITQSAPDGNFSIAATTDYFHDEYFVPTVIAKVDGVYRGAAQATWNGALYVQLGAQYAGKTVELITTRGSEQSESTFFTLETTDRNTAPETFPLDVTSPAEGETVAADTSLFTGEGIPGSRVSVTTDVARAGELCAADVLGDGTWSCEVEGPLAHGAHTMTVTETPYWASAGTPVSTRGFTVGEETEIAPVAVTNPTDPSTGYARNQAFTFEGTGQPGSTITVENKFGTHLGTTDVTTAGAWSWTRANMGTSTWHLHFIQDKGQPGSTTAKVLNFAPAAVTTTPVTVTNPTDPTTGYTRNQAFTFAGTGQPGSTITVENKFGTHIATTTVTEQGTWSWTRANMGTSTWHLHFIQDKDKPGSTVASILGFAPRA